MLVLTQAYPESWQPCMPGPETQRQHVHGIASRPSLHHHVCGCRSVRTSAPPQLALSHLQA